MKIKPIAALSSLLLFSQFSHSGQPIHSDLQANREHIMHQYILDLAKANSEDIISLFEENGTVISTSRGLMSAHDFFLAFLPSIASATTEVHQTFVNPTDTNRIAARFHFNFVLKDGETGDGEYVDEFVFAKNSSKLSQVAMFENLKFNPNNS